MLLLHKRPHACIMLECMPFPEGVSRFNLSLWSPFLGFLFEGGIVFEAVPRRGIWSSRPGLVLYYKATTKVVVRLSPRDTAPVAGYSPGVCGFPHFLLGVERECLGQVGSNTSSFLSLFLDCTWDHHMDTHGHVFNVV